MPKERRDRSVSCDGARRASPFPCSSSTHAWKNSLHVGDVKEWEGVLCPVCMEHPHNAVLLICSSHAKGCRPYMCDTSYRHSNCLDQFRKAFAESSSTQDESHTPTESAPTGGGDNFEEEHPHQEHDEQIGPIPCESREAPKLSCPLCRGHIKDWVVVEPARQLMNAKARSCARESCLFTGTYGDLRKHARRDHPLVRPSEVDPDRQRDWRRMERQRDLGDVLSTIRSATMFGDDYAMFDTEERGEALFPSGDEGNWWTVFLLIRVIRPGGASTTAWSSVPSRSRVRRRASMQELWGENYDGDESGVGEGNGNRSGEDGLQRATDVSVRRRRTRRRTTPEDL